MAGRFPINRDSENFSRLSRLLIDGGTEALRSVFNRLHPSLSHSLSLHRTTLCGLWKPPRGKKKILYDSQWYKLYPPTGSPSLQDFDITLLFVLLRSICPSLSPPATGWDTLPNTTDSSLEANLVRIKFYRNELYGHVDAAAFDDAEFEDYWKKISLPLIALGISADEIDDLKTRPSGATDYVALLEEWKEADVELSREIKDESNRVCKKVKETGQSISKEIQDSEKSISKEIQDSEKRLIRDFKHSLIRPIHEVHQKLDDVTNKDPDEAERVELAKQEKAVNDWKEYLIEEYTSGDASHITPLPWLEFEPYFSIENMYKEPCIRSHDGSTVKMGDLFKSGSKSKTRRVLLEGNPGVGKSSLCKKLVNTWVIDHEHPKRCDTSSSSGTSFYGAFPDEVEVVLLVQCRDLEDASDWKDILRQTVPLSYSDEDKERIIRYICGNEEHIALILDGYDELPSSAEKSLHPILIKKALPKCYTVVTSRKNMMRQELKNRFEKTLEIKGWSVEDAKQLISDYFSSSPDVADKLLYLVEHNDHVREELVLNPLHSAMLCLAFEDNKEIPQTSLNITSLYTIIVSLTTKRYRSNRGLDIEDSGIENRKIKEQLLELGKCAFTALLEDKLSFTVEDLPEELKDMGFLFKNKFAKKTQCQVTFSFVHKSIQDYLAALFFVEGLARGNANVFVDRLYRNIFFRYDLALMIGPDRACAVVKCLAGLLVSRGWTFPPASIPFEKFGFRFDNQAIVYLICEFLHEAMRVHKSILAEVIHLLPQLIEIHPNRMSSNAVSGLCYWLSYRQPVSGSVPLTGKELNDNPGIRELHLFNVTSEACTTILSCVKESVSLRTLRSTEFYTYPFFGTCCISDGLADVLVHNQVLDRLDYEVSSDCTTLLLGWITAGLKENKSLRILTLDNLGNCSEDSFVAFAEVLSGNMGLEELTLGGLDSWQLAVLARALKGNLSIKGLTLRNYGPIFYDDAVAMAEMISKNKVIEKLDFSQDFRRFFDGKSVVKLFDAMIQSTSLKSLGSIDVFNFDDDILTKLSELIRKKRTLINGLRLFGWWRPTRGCQVFANALAASNISTLMLTFASDFEPTVLSSIIKTLKTNTSITTFNLDLQSKTSSADLADLLSENKTIEHLRIYDLHGSIAAIASTQMKNPSLKALHIRCPNEVSSEDAAAFAEMLSHNQVLRELCLEGNIEVEGAIAIASALKTKSVLRELSLYSNNIGDKGAIAIASALKTNSTLENLDLRRNKIGDEGAIAMANALKTNSTLENLDLQENNIGDEGTISMANALKTNSTLRSLDLPHLINRKIGDKCDVAFADMLSCNSVIENVNIGIGRLRFSCKFGGIQRRQSSRR
ncbi:NLR family CARD domain-containing protein 3 [Nematostella vectensis]|uniref:NLR family CARD domain-containing protein 3 n=1 Tax=Nematostella vectensis TaxID=45351 RepID=UPI00207730DC|nr:NLR family CARD domain-containing protein 3 [Nematostella vectensis]XP_048578881.1 NLR family CARD domain-containing protein 3 [Nematostella vectensis]